MTTAQNDHQWEDGPLTLERLQLHLNELTLSANWSLAAVQELQANEADMLDLLARVLDGLDQHGPAGIAAEVDAWLSSRD